MFKKITEHCFFRPAEGYSDRPNVGYVRGEKYSLIFEAGNSAANAEKLKLELMLNNLPQPSYAAVSHWHWDHSFGLHAWDCVKIAGKQTNEKLLEVSGWKWDDVSIENRIKCGKDIVFCTEMIKREYPDRSKIKVCGADIVFDKRLCVNLGGISCELILCGGPHSEDSVICYVPAEKVLFLGDSNCKDLYGKPWHFDIEHEEDFMKNVDAIPYDRELVDRYLKLLDTLDFEICVTGHGGILSRNELYDSLK